MTVKLLVFQVFQTLWVQSSKYTDTACLVSHLCHGSFPQATAAVQKSPNFVAPAEPMKITLAAAVAFANLAGVVSTLDQAPPSFTFLDIQDPTLANNKIVVRLQLNEAGVAYCRATRSDSGETAADMTITRILTANWMAQNDGSNISTIEITQLENVNPLLTSRDDEVAPIMESSQYDVFLGLELDQDWVGMNLEVLNRNAKICRRVGSGKNMTMSCLASLVTVF